MMNRVFAIVMLLLISLLCGCGSSVSHCIKVGGSSDKYSLEDVNVEYCYNPVASEAEGATVLNTAGKDDQYFVVHRKYIDRANDIIQSLSKGVSATSINGVPPQKPSNNKDREEIKAMELFTRLAK